MAKLTSTHSTQFNHIYKDQEKISKIFQTYDYDYTQNVASVVLPGMTPEGKRTEFRPLSDHDGLIGQEKKSWIWEW